MPRFDLTDAQLSNLRFFLDKVTYQGLQEVQAVTDLLSTLSKPIAVSEVSKEGDAPVENP